MEFAPGAKRQKEKAMAATAGSVSDIESGPVNFENITAEEIRSKIEDPKDPIHAKIMSAARSFINSDVRHMGDHVVTADDLAQIASLKILNGADTFNRDSSLNTWIYKITKNAFLDHLRKSKTRRIPKTDSLSKIAEQEHNLPISDLSPTEKEIIINLDNQAFLNSLINRTRIKKRDRALLRMKFTEDLSYKEIAERLGLTEQTIKMRFFNLFHKLGKKSEAELLGIKESSPAVSQNILNIKNAVEKARKAVKNDSASLKIPETKKEPIKTEKASYKPERKLPLSSRENQVLRMLATGTTRKLVAKLLGISVATANEHAEHIIEKLGVKNIMQAIVKAHELKLLDADIHKAKPLEKVFGV